MPPTTITGDDLLNPPQTINLQGTMEEPRFSSSQGLINNVRTSIDEQRTAVEQANQEARQQQQELNALGLQNFNEQRTNLQNQYNIPDDMRELNDIRLQLVDMDTQSGITQTRIEGAAGQTANQAQREVTQEQREAAVRSAGLAARAAVLQGNIQTARTLINDAMNDAYADRETQLKIRQNQLQRAYDVADDERKRLIEQENQKLELEQQQINEVKNAISQAVASGVATQEDIALFSDPRVSDQQKMARAQQLQAQGAGEERALDMAAKRAGIEQGWARINLAEREFEYKQQQDALSAELEALKNAGQLDEQQVQQQQKVENALRMKDLVNQIRGHAGFNLSVGSMGSRIFNPLEGGAVGQLYNYLSGQGEGFDALYDQLTENLTLDNLDKMTGVLTDRDIQVLRSAATRLRKSTTEQEFLNVLQEMEGTFDRAINEYGVTPQQARFYYGVDDETLSEIDALWGDNAGGGGLIDNDTF